MIATTKFNFFAKCRTKAINGAWKVTMYLIADDDDIMFSQLYVMHIIYKYMHSFWTPRCPSLLTSLYKYLLIWYIFIFSKSLHCFGCYCYFYLFDACVDMHKESIGGIKEKLAHDCMVCVRRVQNVLGIPLKYEPTFWKSVYLT